MRLRVEMVDLTIDDQPISVPKGTLVIRAAELMGIQIPRFCDHPLLDPVGACRQCLVEVEGQRKPMASCTITVHPRHGGAHAAHLGVRRQGPARRDGAAADQPSAGLPGLRQGRRMPAAEPGDVQRPGRDPLRRRQTHVPQADPDLVARCCSTGNGACCARGAPGSPSRSPATRSSSCWNAVRCSRSASPPASRSTSYFSGNTVQICPVGALTGTAYRFRARPFDLVSSPSACEHCASGCAQRTDHRRGKVLRRLAGDDPEVNEEWNCDKGRWAFTYASESATASPHR